MSLVSFTKHDDHGPCRQVYGLGNKEYGVPNQGRVDEKQRRCNAPHRERGNAEASRAALSNEVHDLRHVARNDQSGRRRAQSLRNHHKRCPASDWTTTLQRSQVNGLILQPIEIQFQARSYQRQYPADVSRPVEPNGRVDSPVVDIAAKITAGIQPPANDKFFPCRMETDVLQIEVELIRPEPRYLVVRIPLAEHVASSRSALSHRVLPMLEAKMAAKERMTVIRDVAGGEDARDVGLQDSSTTTPFST